MLSHAVRYAIAALVFGACACSSPDYVPDTGWSDSESEADFYEDWFGKQLAAAKEPSLSGRDDLGPFVSRFRLLVLPSFAPASIYRIDETSSGQLKLSYTKLNGAGGYEPGWVTERWQRGLSPGETITFRKAIELAKLPEAHREGGPNVTLDDNSKEVMILCFDGTRFVFELLSAEQRHFVTRHDCELDRDGELGELIEFVSGLAL